METETETARGGNAMIQITDQTFPQCASQSPQSIYLYSDWPKPPLLADVAARKY